MTSSQGRKGADAEREVAALLTEHLGVYCRRQLGAGRKDDVGDIAGLRDCVVQVANWPSDTLRAVRVKPLDAEAQRGHAAAAFAATFVRLRGGVYRVVLTPEQFFTLYREAVA